MLPSRETAAEDGEEGSGSKAGHPGQEDRRTAGAGAGGSGGRMEGQVLLKKSSCSLSRHHCLLIYPEADLDVHTRSGGHSDHAAALPSESGVLGLAKSGVHRAGTQFEKGKLRKAQQWDHTAVQFRTQ